MRTKAIRTLALGAAMAVLIGVSASPTGAAPGLQISTPYPAVSTQSGKTVTLNLDVITPTRQRVALAIVAVPPGWQATLRGGGFVIQGVFGSPKTKDESPPQVQLEVRVPGDAAQGTYRVAVKGTAAGATDTLAVDLTVSETAAGAFTLIPEFPSQRGSSTDTFSFNVTLTNNTPEKTTFSLSAEGPQGWDISAKPTTEQRATTVSVEGGSTSQVQVSADPPDDITAGTYPVKVRAAGGGKSAEAALTVEITGNFKMQLTTPSERLSAKAVAGKVTELQLVVKNTGTAALSDVKLSSSPPTGWKVDFKPETVRRIEPKSSARVTARLTPSADAVSGDYQLSLTATAGATTSPAEFRITVRASAFTGFLAILLIAAVIAGILWVFRRYGRR